MNYSAVLVVARPGRLHEAIKAIGELEGVCVHQYDVETGRLICTIEAETEDREIERFNTTAQLESVLDISLLSHYVDLPVD